jgi:Fe-Mn family superoxide dismutase
MDASVLPQPMALALAANFGSVERWREEFIAMGKTPGDASNSVLLMFQPREGTLVNQPAPGGGGIPILVFDKPDDIEAFVASIDWNPVYERYQEAVHAASEPFGTDHEEVAGALLLDVRRAGVFEQAASMIPGARWRDPAAVGHWAGELPSDREVVVYCVYGHEVGRSTAMRLRAAGLQARFLRGGIDGWQHAGRPLAAKPDGPERAT